MRSANVVSSAMLGVIVAVAVASEAQEKAWNALPPLRTPRSNFALTALADGRLLAVGGAGPTGALMTDCEIYDPVARAWTATAPMPMAWPFPELVLLADGRVLLAGLSAGSPLIFDPSTAAWASAAARSRTTPLNHAVLLADGRVFLMGRGVTIAEILDPSTNTWADTSALDADRSDGTLTLLADGRVLVAGGFRLGGTAATTGVVYDPTTDSWTTTGPLVQTRRFHSASRLLDGRVFIAGGGSLVSPYPALGSAEIYDPTTNAWTATAGSMVARTDHTATLLSSGQVLLAGGTPGSGARLDTVEAFEPATGLFLPADPLKQARYAHRAATFSDGTPVVAGGVGDFNATSNAEVYSDPLPDVGPPTVSLVNPTDGSVVSGIVTLEATASDDTGIASVGFYRGASVLLCEVAAPPFQCNWDTATVFAGAHTITAKARDWANKTAQSSAGVTVQDLLPPNVQLTTPAAGATAGNPMLFEATAGDVSGISKVEFLVDGVVVGSDDVQPYQAKISPSRVGAGVHQATAQATDGAGNVATSSAVEFVAPVAPVTAIHDPLLGVPACGGGGDCDSGALLVGRGPLGPEPHMPNTIGGTCLDGFTGVFHSSQSLDRLRIRTTDASPFAAGQTVVVDATVWTASMNDRLDLYYATDAQSPVWTLVATRNPGYPGQRSVTIQFPLAAGADRQAIRGVVRYGSTPVPGQPACFRSGRDDHDDLAFTLGVPTAASGGAAYDANLRTPACLGFGSECDSAAMLVGRGSTGLEPNQPNTTLDSCADGTTGDHLSSPSVERVRVVSSGGPLRRGGSASIQVSVYAHWGSTYERLYLYEAIDTSDTWRYLGSVSPSGFGYKTLSLPYSLIGSATTRAIRAAYRLLGPPASVACAPGAYNDHDDLWFRVDAPAGSHTLAIDGESQEGASGSIEISSSGTPAGSCSAPGRCFQDFPGGASLTLTPVAGPGSVFAGFIGACGGLSACTLPMTEARQVGARFLLN
jgi:hypothetical protein